MTSTALPALLLAAALSAGAATAQAAQADDPLRAAVFAGKAPGPMPASFSVARGPAARTGADALPKRSLDLRFAPKDVTGSLGFLCGREPGQSHTGSASAFGHDPHGRFLGAKLSRAF